MKPLPRKGQKVKVQANDGTIAILSKCSSGRDWYLSLGSRCRFGNAREIRQDILHFEEFGKLPEQKVFA